MDKNQYYFKSITLKTSKLSEMYHFYVGQLGFKCKSENKDNFVIECGSTDLCFEEWPNLCQYHFAFNIPENQILKSAEWIKEFADIIKYENKEIVDFPNWNAHSLYFLDPSGNIVEFIARHNLPNSSTQEFTFDSITELSEIGVPAENLAKMIDLFKKQLDFDIYWGDSEKFAAVGHERCLFITVPLDREWFPTDNIISKIQPLKVVLEAGNKQKVLIQSKKSYRFTE